MNISVRLTQQSNINCVSVLYSTYLTGIHSGRNISSNTNTIHIYCCCVCLYFIPARIFRPIQVKYTFSMWLPLCLVFISGRNIPSNFHKYNTHLVLLSLSCIHIPAGIFRPIQIQYTFIVVVSVLYLYSGRNFPAGIFRPIQIQYTFIALSVVYCSFSCRNIPAGIFRPIQIQYHIHCCCLCLVFIFRPEFSGRNIPSKYKYHTHLLLLCLFCIYFPAGIFRIAFVM